MTALKQLILEKVPNLSRECEEAIASFQKPKIERKKIDPNVHEQKEEKQAKEVKSEKPATTEKPERFQPARGCKNKKPQPLPSITERSSKKRTLIKKVTKKKAIVPIDESEDTESETEPKRRRKRVSEKKQKKKKKTKKESDVQPNPSYQVPNYYLPSFPQAYPQPYSSQTNQHPVSNINNNNPPTQNSARGFTMSFSFT